jgi:hypothetical protein
LLWDIQIGSKYYNKFYTIAFLQFSKSVNLVYYSHLMMDSFGENMYCTNGTHFEWGNKSLCDDVTFIICIKNCNMQLEAAIFSSP